jgi:succinate dehydrogenase / fumarate reductase iron-sulfur subunit
MDTFILRVYRGIAGKQYWEEFELSLAPGLNMISALMEIQKNPVNRKGERVTPVAWEQGCLEEVCGSCSMLVNSRPRQGCTALIRELLPSSGVLTVAPLTKFPLIRDLVVDRTSVFDALKKVQAWVAVDDAYNRGPGPKISPELQEAMYVLATCMSCGCCSEACPQVHARSSFIGPAAISQARLFNAHPVGGLMARERLHVLTEEGGVSSCGNAQNCAAVCPKKIPLTESIAVMGRQVVQHALHQMTGVADS